MVRRSRDAIRRSQLKLVDGNEVDAANERLPLPKKELLAAWRALEAQERARKPRIMVPKPVALSNLGLVSRSPICAHEQICNIGDITRQIEIGRSEKQVEPSRPSCWPSWFFHPMQAAPTPLTELHVRLKICFLHQVPCYASQHGRLLPAMGSDTA